MTNFSTLIEVDELAAALDTRSVRVVDCRFDLLQPAKGRADYLAGHIPGAVFADLDRDLAGPVTAETGRHPLPDVGEFVSRLEGWGIGDDTRVVAYDQSSGALAARLWWLLRWIGHERVALLNGGLSAWQRAAQPLETKVPEYPRATLAAARRPEMVATVADVELAVNGQAGMTLVDARDPVRFAGKTEPIDTVAGHVPGALNLPFSANLGPEGCWKSAGDIRRTWESLLGERTDGSLAVMCGSGVTACHLALSAVIAGIPEPRVFVGSWSEWIRDPARPVARDV